MTYREFFTESPEGVELLKKFHYLIDQAHERAENDPDTSRDNMQQAKGIREVIGLCMTLSAPKQEVKTPKALR